MNKPYATLRCKHDLRVDYYRKCEASYYCRYDGWQEIVSIALREWHVFCLHCTYSRWMGTDRRAANRRVRNHGMNHPTHTVMAVIDKVTKDGKGIAKAEAMRAATAVHDVRSNDLTMRTDLRSVSWAPTVVLTGEQPPF